MSENIDEILRGSPIVAKILVEELEYSTRSSLLDIDVYWCTITEILKGEPDPDKKVIITFFADTVNKGEEYIVAIKIINDGDENSSPSAYLTSKNSLFDVTEIEAYMDLED